MDFIKILFGDYTQLLMGLINNVFATTMESTLKFEDNLTMINISAATNYITTFSIALLTAKLLHKLFGVYVANTDGDASTSPVEYLKAYGKAIVIILTFSYLYSTLVDIVVEFFNTLLTSLNASYNSNILGTLYNRATSGFYIVILIIYLICGICLVVNIYMNGITIMILRMGIPLAMVTMVDGNNNKFTAIMQIIYKLILTSMAQIILFNLSVATSGNLLGAGFFLSVSLMFGAFNIVNNFGEIFAMSSGSGLARKTVNISREVWQTAKLLGGR